ncbi:MAG: hypothetical protein O7G85_04875 [Planctomycetota bacterium]|nr:hypothetical protein [Planctomycetota bacterium]
MMNRRCILIPGVYLALSLTINFLVAWSCALWSPMSESNNPLALTTYELRQWIDKSPWPHKLRPGKTISSSSFGLAYQRLESENPEPHFWHVARSVKAGFPLPGLYGERWSNVSDNLAPQDQLVFISALNPDRFAFLSDDISTRLLPLRPVLPGFLTNTILYAGILYLLGGAIRAIKGHRRFKHHRCPKCDETLVENCNDACPTCGWQRGVTNAHAFHDATG